VIVKVDAPVELFTVIVCVPAVAEYAEMLSVPTTPFNTPVVERVWADVPGTAVEVSASKAVKLVEVIPVVATLFVPAAIAGTLSEPTPVEVTEVALFVSPVKVIVVER